MFDRHNHNFADSLAAGFVVAVLAGVFFLVSAVLTLITRVYFKHRQQRVIVGIAVAWSVSLCVALVIASVPDATAVAIWFGVGTTGIALCVLAATEIFLDQRALHHQVTDDSVVNHLQDWWR